MAAYAGTYSDRSGREPITVENDGDILSVTIRGVRFSGPDFDGFRPEAEATDERLQSFTLNRGDLCDCALEFVIPVPLRVGSTFASGDLAVSLALGPPGAKGGLAHEHLRLRLTFPGGSAASSGRSGWFEDELLDIAAKLPGDVCIETCAFCAYSDYSPSGHGLFGALMCFRNIKADYLAVRSKADFWKVFDRGERFVQETFRCEEFHVRTPGTGYRG